MLVKDVLKEKGSLYLLLSATMHAKEKTIFLKTKKELHN